MMLEQVYYWTPLFLNGTKMKKHTIKAFNEDKSSYSSSDELFDDLGIKL
jgi:hypothetical protein